MLPASQCDAEPTETYQRRIEPVLSDDNPKSCNQCHLSGVDLNMFVRDTPCETMACLVDQGMVNLESPAESQILTWISRASPDSELITDQVIQAEYDGFLEWIQANASCPEACRGVTCGAPDAAQTCDLDPEPWDDPPDTSGIAGCDDLSLETLFQQTVWAWRGRCFPCHFSDQENAPAEAPRWLSVDGNCATAALQTMKNIINSGYINTDDPTQSLLLMKPLALEAGGVAHGGHDKFADQTDPSYVAFLEFIQRYTDCTTP